MIHSPPSRAGWTENTDINQKPEIAMLTLPTQKFNKLQRPAGRVQLS
ncbi:MAG: hypothetical protein ACTSXU_04520 [Promethearchaeota archaeon]